MKFIEIRDLQNQIWGVNTHYIISVRQIGATTTVEFLAAGAQSVYGIKTNSTYEEVMRLINR